MEPTPLIQLDCHVAAGSFTLALAQRWSAPAAAVFGVSGAGKSLLIELLAGFRRTTRGVVQFAGEVLDDGRRHVPPRRRRFGWVPQDLALWPHMTVRQHLRYGATRPDAAFEERVVALLELRDLLDRRPAELSGGQRQRVALARAVAAQPRLLLLDEPLASLDAPLRGRIVPYIRRLQSELGTPYLYVSHDPAEIFALADHVLVLAEGRCTAAGPPALVLGSPGRPMLADERFTNRFDVTVAAARPADGLAELHAAGGLVLLAPLAYAPPVGRAARAGIDPLDIIVSVDPPHGLSAQNRIPGVVARIDVDGAAVLLRVRHAGGAELRAALTHAALRELALHTGQHVFLVFKAHAVHLL